jgi:hypothetical protein
VYGIIYVLPGAGTSRAPFIRHSHTSTESPSAITRHSLTMIGISTGTKRGVYTEFSCSFNMKRPITLAAGQAGYTSFWLRLDNVTGVQYGAGSKNTLALFVDATFGMKNAWHFSQRMQNLPLVSCEFIRKRLVMTAVPGTGWWYEGGTLMLNTHLI